MEILNFINFKFEDLHKAKKLGFGVLSYSRAAEAEHRRQSRRSSRHKSLLLRRKISLTMEPITPERSNSKKNIFIKPEVKENKMEIKNEKPDRRQMLQKWRQNREQKMKEEKKQQKPIFKVGGPSNVGFPTLKENENKMNYSFAPKKHEFKAPANIKPLPMNLPPLRKEIKEERNIETKSKPLKTTTNKNVIKSKPTVVNKNINIKPTKPETNKITNDTTKSKNLKTNSKITSSANTNRFLRVTRSQKVISSPVKLKSTLPSKNIRNNRKIPKVINREEEKAKVQFQNSKTEDKKNIEYKKTPMVPKIVETEVDNQVTEDNQINEENNQINEENNHINEDIDDIVTENKTPKLRKSLRIKKITESEKYEPVCIVCKFSCSNKQHQQSPIEDDANKSNKRKTIDATSTDCESNYKAATKKTRKSDYNKTQDDAELIESVKTPKRRTRQNAKNIEDSAKNKKNTRKSLNSNTEKIVINAENEKENSQQKTKTPKKTPKKNILTENNDNKKTKTPLKKPTTKTPEKETSSSLATEYSMDLNSSNSDNVFITPDSKNNSRSSIYISPFVTTSRGKGSTKRENKTREVLGIDPYSAQNNTDTGTKYFHTILDNVIERLKNECNMWEKYKESENITEDAKDLIDVALGQTNLLINKKFQQFRNLIHNCENGDGECPVTCEDLQGFWDMVYMQVSNLDTRFKRLSDLKDNNWEEILPPTKKVVQTKKTKSVPQPKGKSNIREAIKAARLKSKSAANKSENNETVFDGGFFVVKSPNKTDKNTPNKKTPNKRKSLLTHVLSAEAKKTGRISCSPGLATLKLSQTLKSVGKNKDLNQTLPTPGKSILKKKDHIKPHNISKVVLFKDEDSDGESNE